MHIENCVDHIRAKHGEKVMSEKQIASIEKRRQAKLEAEALAHNITI